MDQVLTYATLTAALINLPMGGIRFFQTINSTNDQALTWAAEDAPDMSLVIANEQSAGRGRNGRKWYSPLGEALAFSLILRLEKEETRSVGLFSALGALAVVKGINHIDASFDPKIKWPNDVLVNDKKICGVLSEATWRGDRIESLVIGIGINISKKSVPPMNILNYPATSLEELMQANINKLDLLGEILNEVVIWRKRINSRSFIDAWQEKLAYRGEMVNIWSANSDPRTGIITGIEPDGGLSLLDQKGQKFTIHFGEVHLKPIYV